MSQKQAMMEMTKRLLRVALVGAPNAGKSTILNRLVESDISCVSNKVHTTRRNILGVYTRDDTQLEFYDSPGLINRQHSLRHHLEDTMIRDPVEASNKCDLIAVIVDASNEREQYKLNKGLLGLLDEHRDKKSFLVLNKVDLVNDKRKLLDIGARLSEGYLNGECINPQVMKEIRKKRRMYEEQLKPRSKYVVDLKLLESKENNDDPNLSNRSTRIAPIGYRNFSQIFSVSALHDDGVEEFREHLIDMALPVAAWPHGPEYLSSQKTQEIVHGIIRGKVMDSVDHQLPYLIRYNYLEVRVDEFGSLHIHLELVAPKKYMVGKLLGQHGVTIFNIINESRELISKTLATDVKLNIEVKARVNH